MQEKASFIQNDDQQESCHSRESGNLIFYKRKTTLVSSRPVQTGISSHLVCHARESGHLVAMRRMIY